MFATLTCISMAFAGGAWRRTLGGWDGLLHWAKRTPLWGFGDDGQPAPRRSLILAVGWVLSWPLWIAFSWEFALCGTIAIDLFWRFGHKLDSSKIWFRYGPFAAPWVLARKLWGNKPERSGDFLNNWMALGEMGAGAMFYSLLPLVLLFE